MSVKVFQSSSRKNKPVEKELIEIKVLEKYSPEVIEFDSKEEFIEHLADNLEEMNKMTTQKLNKTYKIQGYRITKLKNKVTNVSDISLKKDSTERAERTEKTDEIIHEINDLKAMMKQLLDLLVQ